MQRFGLSASSSRIRSIAARRSSLSAYRRAGDILAVLIYGLTGYSPLAVLGYSPSAAGGAWGARRVGGGVDRHSPQLRKPATAHNPLQPTARYSPQPAKGYDYVTTPVNRL